MNIAPAPATLIVPILIGCNVASSAHAGTASVKNNANSIPPNLRIFDPLFLTHHIVMHRAGEQIGAPFAAMQLVLVGDMLAPGIDAGEGPPEATLGEEPRRTRDLDQPRRQRTAPLG